MRTMILLAAITVLGFVSAPVVEADEGSNKPSVLGDDHPYSDAAKLLFRHADEAYTAGQYEEAVRLLNLVYEIEPRPKLLFDIGRAYELLPDFCRADEYFRRYLEKVPSEKADVWKKHLVRDQANCADLKAAKAAIAIPTPAAAAEQAVNLAAVPAAPPLTRDKLFVPAVVTGATGVVALAVGGVLMLHVNANYDAARATCIVSRSTVCWGSLPDEQTAAKALDVAGAVVAAGSAALWTMTLYRRYHRKLNLSMTYAPGGATVGIGGVL